MRKNFNIEELKKSVPFKTPDGYFDTLTSRIMSQIPEESASAEQSKPQEKKGKVVGMIPRKKNRGWVKWVAAAAACVCGLALFLTNNDDKQAEQTVMLKAQTSTTEEETVEPAATSNVEAANVKHYANDAFPLSARHKRSTYVAEPQKKYTAYVPAEHKSVASTSNSSVAQKTNEATKASSSVRPSQSSHIAANTITISASDIGQMNNEYDLLDYTQMGGSEIYDYLAGNDYY